MSGTEDRLKGRTVLVTGASGGIGGAICRRLLAAGARVVGGGRDFSRQPLLGPGAETVVMDFEDLDRLGPALEALARAQPQVDAVVANAGFGRFGSLEEFSWSQIRSLLDVNLTAQIFLAKAFLPRLKGRGGGDLLFMGSEAALAGGRKGAVYCASKFALRGLAQSLRQECAKSGVRVSMIHPGMVRTDFFEALSFEPGEDADNFLLPEDVAEAVVTVLKSRPQVVFDEITLSPLKRLVRSKERAK